MAKNLGLPALAIVVLFALGYAAGAYFTGNSWGCPLLHANQRVRGLPR